MGFPHAAMCMFSLTRAGSVQRSNPVCAVTKCEVLQQYAHE